ncbi:MAG: serine hydrolase [Chitinophagaceae bacterium]
MNKFFIYFLLPLSCFTVGCAKLSDPDPHYSYNVPDDVQNEFSVSPLAAEGMDENIITEVTNLIVSEKYKRIDALLILRNNKLVYENYFHGYSGNVLHNIFSAGKSITSILVGIAIDKGFIDDIHTPVIQLLPEYENFGNPDPWKNEITIEHLLNMTSGLDCDDWNKQTEGKMQQSNDWVKFTLDLPMVRKPGSAPSYCTGCPVTLGRVIENRSGLSIQEFADKYLFKPLNIDTYQWHIMPDGKASAGGLFYMRPRDMAKIGLLMLNNGQYNGVQIVAPGWVEQSSQIKEQSFGSFDGYGYLWWKQAFDGNIEAYFADGNGGQQLFIIPSRNLVMVFTSGNQNTGIGLQNFEIVNKYILPSIQ